MPMYPPWSRSEKHRPGEGSLSSLNKTCTAYCIFALGIICSSICDEVHKPQFSNLLTLCSCRKSERGSCWRSPGQAAKAHLFEVDSHGARRLVQRQLGTVDTQVPLLLLLLLLLASEAAKKFTMQIRFCLNFANELEILVRPLSHLLAPRPRIEMQHVRSRSSDLSASAQLSSSRPIYSRGHKYNFILVSSSNP